MPHVHGTGTRSRETWPGTEGGAHTSPSPAGAVSGWVSGEQVMKVRGSDIRCDHKTHRDSGFLVTPHPHRPRPASRLWKSTRGVCPRVWPGLGRVHRATQGQDTAQIRGLPRADATPGGPVQAADPPLRVTGGGQRRQSWPRRTPGPEQSIFPRGRPGVQGHDPARAGLSRE